MDSHGQDCERSELAGELIAMAEEDLAAQAPLAELMDRDPAFAEWIERAVTPRVPLPLALWDLDSTPPAGLTRARDILDRHDARLAEIVDDVGWPGRSLVGEDGADAAWLLAQHGDRHQELRTGWLPLVQRAVAAGEADPRHLSRLTDRVAMIDGRPQLYGTYASVGDDGDVHWDIPVDGSPADVDARRAAIGLPPLRDDLAEPPGTGPYRYLRKTSAFAWPRRR